jgi:hypothetical protein
MRCKIAVKYDELVSVTFLANLFIIETIFGNRFIRRVFLAKELKPHFEVI